MERKVVARAFAALSDGLSARHRVGPSYTAERRLRPVRAAERSGRRAHRLPERHEGSRAHGNSGSW
jgi:hypothetical protein